MSDIHFNVNQHVKAKLTDHGHRIMRNWYADRVYNAPTVDDQGYVKIQMWHFMRIFGEYMSLGAEPVFDMNIILCVED